MASLIKQGYTADYPYEIAAAQRLDRIWDTDFAQWSDNEIWERCRRDAYVAFMIDARRRLVGGLDWNVSETGDGEGDKRAAQIMRVMLEGVKRFAAARTHLTEAIFRGSSWLAVMGEWRVTEIAGIRSRWWCPTELVHVDKRRFRLQREPGDERHGWHMYSPVSEGRGSWGWIPIGQRRDWFVRHVFDEVESSLHYGRGLLETVFFYLQAKTTTLALGLDGVETWARGWIVGKVGENRASSEAKDNAAQASAMLSALENMRSRGVFVHGESEEVSVIRGGGEGHQIVDSFLRYLDQGLALAILGSNTPLLDRGGSYAMAVEKNDDAENLIAYDRQSLEETITDDLLGLIWRVNARQFRAIGSKNMPRFVLESKEGNEKESIAIATGLARLGLPVGLAELYERSGYTKPGQGQETTDPDKARQPQTGAMEWPTLTT